MPPESSNQCGGGWQRQKEGSRNRKRHWKENLAEPSPRRLWHNGPNRASGEEHSTEGTSRTTASSPSGSGSSSSSDDSSSSFASKRPRRVAIGPERSVMGWNVFVTGLPLNTSPEDVQDFFEQYGKVQCVRIVPTPRQPAIVEFSSQEEGQNAINQCHERSFRKEDGGTPLHVSWAFVLSPPRTGYHFL